jgi:hypothetical protein
MIDNCALQDKYAVEASNHLQNNGCMAEVRGLARQGSEVIPFMKIVRVDYALTSAAPSPVSNGQEDS